MAKWWYITIHRCPDCGAEYESYDSSGPWYDSGLSTCPVIEEFCEECFESRRAEDEKENVVTDHEKAELLLWDFARRAQQDEDRAYQQYKRFRDASLRIETAQQERQIAEERRVMRYFDTREARGY